MSSVFDDDVITGEAVMVDVRPASFVVRGLALALDLLVMGTVALILGFAIVSTTADDATNAALALVSVLLVLLGLPVTVETLSRGRSLGKLAAGLRVVRDDGGPIRVRHALIRGLLAVPEIYLASGSLALIVSLLNKRGKRLGDLLAGTYVIRERSVRPMPVFARMPPWLAGWAAGADLGRLPDRLALASRQFLVRQTSLNPGDRERLARELADQILPLVAPAPPRGTRAEDFVAAVLAERTRREIQRLQDEAWSRQRRDDERRRAVERTTSFR